MNAKRVMMMGAVVAALCATGVRAQTAATTDQAPRRVTPIMMALVDPIQAPSSDWDVKGLRINWVYGNCRNFTGLDLGLINWVEEKAVGLQIGAGNCATTANVLQIGVINVADEMQGMQIGLVNYSRMAIGIQIGAVNVIEDKDAPFMPIINASF